MKKVLIVDDDASYRMLLSQYFDLLNVPSIMAANGKEGIDILLEEDIGLILMDMEMPRMNGRDAVVQIRSQLAPPKCDVPVLLMSGHDDTEFETKYRSYGFNGQISKDITPDQIERFARFYLI